MKQRIINFLFRNLLNTVVFEDLLTQDKAGTIYIGGEKVTDTLLRQLIAEAKALDGFLIWKLMNEKIKEDALDRGWNKSVKMEDLNTGKTMFYVLDLQNSIIKFIKGKEKK